MSSTVAIPQRPKRSANPGEHTRAGDRARVCGDSGFAHARHAHRTPLSHDRPEMTDTHGGPDWLAAPLFRFPRCSSRAAQPTHTKHTPDTQTYTYKHTHPTTTNTTTPGSAPEFPTVPSLPVSPNLPPMATSVSPIVFGDR